MKERILAPTGFSTEKETYSLTPEQIADYKLLIREASFAEAFPHQSGYHVKTAGMTKDGTVWRGGNKEFKRIRKSGAWAHGETAVAGALKDSTSSPIEAIAWWYKEGEVGPNNFGRPCGACRDVLLDYCGPDLVLLTGNESGFVYTRLKDFLFEDFRFLNLDHVHSNEVNTAIDGIRGAVDVFLNKDIKRTVYGSALVSKDGSMWRGSLYTNAGYDDVPPTLTSEIYWRGSYPLGTVSEKHLRLSRLVIVCESEIPVVSYRDRQAILTGDEIRRRYTGEGPLRIELVHAKKNTHGSIVIYEAACTNSEEWLPHPFSAGAFRWDDVIDAQLKQLTGN